MVTDERKRNAGNQASIVYKEDTQYRKSAHKSEPIQGQIREFSKGSKPVLLPRYL